MTAHEIDMLQKFFDLRVGELKAELAQMRDEASADHRAVKAELKGLSGRVEALEDHDAVEESRKQFRDELTRTLTRRVGVCTSAIVGIGGFALALLQQFVF